MAKSDPMLPALLDLKEKKSLATLKTDARVDEIMFMVTTGISNARIVKDAMVKYTCSKATANAYLTKALMELSNYSRTHTIDIKLSQRVAQLEALYEACVLVKDYKTAASVMKQLTDLTVPPQVREHNVTVTARHATMTQDEKAERLKSLLAERERFIEATASVIDVEEIKELHEEAVEEFGDTDKGET